MVFFHISDMYILNHPHSYSDLKILKKFSSTRQLLSVLRVKKRILSLTIYEKNLQCYQTNQVLHPASFMQRKNKFNKENIVKFLLFRVYLSIITVQLGMLSDLLGINKHVSVSKFVLKYRANIKYMYGIVTEYTSNRLLE